MGPSNLDRMTTIYGPTTWEVYARLDESLEPRGPDTLHELAATLLPAGDAVILDAGCRDGHHLIRLVQANPRTTAIGVEPVEIHVERANAAVQAAGLQDRIRVHRGIIHEVPNTPPGSIDRGEPSLGDIHTSRQARACHLRAPNVSPNFTGTRDPSPPTAPAD